MPVTHADHALFCNGLVIAKSPRAHHTESVCNSLLRRQPAKRIRSTPRVVIARQQMVSSCNNVFIDRAAYVSSSFTTPYFTASPGCVYQISKHQVNFSWVVFEVYENGIYLSKFFLPFVSIMFIFHPRLSRLCPSSFTEVDGYQLRNTNIWISKCFAIVTIQNTTAILF